MQTLDSPSRNLISQNLNLKEAKQLVSTAFYNEMQEHKDPLIAFDSLRSQVPFSKDKRTNTNIKKAYNCVKEDVRSWASWNSKKPVNKPLFLR